ncbi:unnamed protein product [Caenorhabditis auriculariae]|uniref:Uncharacterized protein n=1 Tax=Caenorhabditis auriculariae TaxID=2777116 RepID=A0A8S1GZW0_9PELO|nr:unnamed protein product [Caenorhabditis auriculariae]
MASTRLIALLAAIFSVAFSAVSDMGEKRSPLGTMRFGKRDMPMDVEDFEENGYPPYYLSKKADVAVGDYDQIYRDTRSPLGTMRFGKRSAAMPLGTMRFGKRDPLGTMRFGK